VLSIFLRMAALLAFILVLIGVTTSFSLLVLGLALWVLSTLVDNYWGPYNRQGQP
jgi:hypothetical protein